MVCGFFHPAFHCRQPGAGTGALDADFQRSSTVDSTGVHLRIHFDRNFVAAATNQSGFNSGGTTDDVTVNRDDGVGGHDDIVSHAGFLNRDGVFDGFGAVWVFAHHHDFFE